MNLTSSRCLHALVVKCRTRKLEILRLSLTGSCECVVRLSVVKAVQNRSLEPVKPKKDTNNVSCCHGMT